jgi:hypothetical protein
LPQEKELDEEMVREIIKTFEKEHVFTVNGETV